MKKLITTLFAALLMTTMCFGQSQQSFDRPVSLNGASNVINNAYVLGELYLNGTNLILYIDENFTKYSITNSLATTNYVNNLVTNLTTYDYLYAAILPYVSTTYVNNSVAPLATTTYVNNVVSPLATTQYVDIAVTNNLVVTSGTVLPFATTNPPTGWLECDGRALSRTTYTNLFINIGTSFGTTHATNFFIPDLRGTFVRGWDHGRGYDPDRLSRTFQTTGGNTGDKVGSIQGDTYTSHNHLIYHNEGDRSGDVWKTEGTGNEAPITDTTDYYSGSTESRPKNTYLVYYIRY